MMKKYQFCLIAIISIFFSMSIAAQNPLTGNYTINTDASQNPDYTSLQSAVDAIVANGLNGHVIFDIASGIYQGNIVIPEITGVDSLNTITFNGESKNDVVITHSPGYLEKPTIEFNGADFITFKNLTITVQSNYYGTLVVLKNGVRDLCFDNVKFQGLVVTSPTYNNDKHLIYDISKDVDDINISFKNCTFIEGNMALYFQGRGWQKTNDKNLLVENCEFINQFTKSLYLMYQEFATIRNNKFYNNKDLKNNFQALDAFRCNLGTVVENNVVDIQYDSKAGTGLEFRYCLGTEEHPFIIRNNMVNVFSNSDWSYCYYFSKGKDESHNIIIAHNTAKLYGNTKGATLCAAQYFPHLTILNNLLVNECAEAVSLRFNQGNNTDITCNYNIIKNAGTNFGRFGSEDIASFDDWKSTTGFDANSSVIDVVSFSSPTDLHLTSSTNITVANPLSYVTLDIDGELRSTTSPCAGADEFSDYIPDTPATFEDVTIGTEGIWQAADTGVSYITSGSHTFYHYNNLYNGTSYYWNGFTASNQTDTTLSAVPAQYVAIPAQGAEESANYAVANTYNFEAVVSELSGNPKVISGCYVTNNTYAYKSMLNGDGFNPPFGGDTGDEPDWFKICAVGVKEDGTLTDTLYYYLADYRFDDNSLDYILNDWKWFDLSTLGEVVSVKFGLQSSQNNNWGMTTPAYFCMDNFDGEAPQIIVEPPVIVHQLEPIIFTENPQSLVFDLQNTFATNNPQDIITLSIVSATASEYTATLSGKTLTVSRNEANAFSNVILTIRATSNDLYVDMDVTVSGHPIYNTDTPATFEDVAIGPNGYWEAPGTGENYLISGTHSFYQYNDYYGGTSYYWGGFTASNQTDTTLSGFNAQYVSVTAGGVNNSDSYGVAFTMGYPTDITEVSGNAKVISGCYVTNNVYAYKSILNGDGFNPPFGGDTGNDPDWFKLCAVGTNATGNTTDTLFFYLADYRFEDNSQDYIVDDWQWFDLSGLGEVVSVRFILKSSRNNNWGMTTPAYFCIDDYDGEAPSEPPFIAEQLEPIIFTENPQSLVFDLQNTFATNNPQDIITLSIVSVTSPEYTASLSGNTLTVSRNEANAFSNAILTIRATSNDLYVDMNVTVSGHPVYNTDTPATFEDVAIGTNGYWEAPGTGENYFISGTHSFYQYNDYYGGTSYYWGGFTASNQTDTTLSGFEAQYVSITAGGANNSDSYGVAYTMGYPTDITEVSGNAKVISGCYVTNNVYAYKSILNGDGFNSPFGGDTGDEPDWFKLCAVGTNAAGNTTDTLFFYLADYRFDDNTQDYIVDDWQWFDLTELGEVVSVRFILQSSRNNDWGMLTPAYFCIDDYDGEAPEVDEPPYIAEQLEDILFTNYPESFSFDLENNFKDPDENDIITLSIVSDPVSEFTTALNNYQLTITRNTNNAFENIPLVIRATSNDLYVDMTVNVSGLYFDGIDNNSTIDYSLYPNPAIDYIIIGGADNYSYNIYNSNGQVILSGTGSNESKIDISSVAAGTYMIRINNNNNFTTLKFIKR